MTDALDVPALARAHALSISLSVLFQVATDYSVRRALVVDVLEAIFFSHAPHLWLAVYG